MASASTEAAEIRRRGRHRLIGAIAIVALLVIFVPMIFDREPAAPQPEPSLEIPAKDKAAPLPSPAPAKRAVEAKEAEKAAEAPAAPPPKLEGFAVQVGAFKDEDKLKQARDKLAAAGISHFVERRDAPNGALNRLRAGPYPTREAAEKGLAAVKAASLDGQVVPLP